MMLAVVGARFQLDGAYVEVRRGRAERAVCMTCGAAGDVGDVIGHDVSDGRAHVWAMVGAGVQLVSDA